MTSAGHAVNAAQHWLWSAGKLPPNATIYEKAVQDVDAFTSVFLPADKAEVNMLHDDIGIIKVCSAGFSHVA